jgi:hypothetical protein
VRAQASSCKHLFALDPFHESTRAVDDLALFAAHSSALTDGCNVNIFK